MPENNLSYVLITPARNAEDLIELTIESVIKQSVLPRKWVIVNDGSTDNTQKIVSSYTARFPWIELLQMPERKQYDLSGKAASFNAALQHVKDLDFDVIANVDADISVDEDYFSFLLEKFAAYPKLGVAGTPMREPSHDAVADALFNETDVFGACQVFRRRCLEDVGGYLPLKRGGLDWAAVRMARMKGWETRSFLEKRFFHHRIMGATDCSVWRACLNHGRKDYYLGNHPLWQLFRVVYQMTRRPLVLKGTLLFAGYVWEFLTTRRRPIPPELVRFHRQEELRRLRSILGGLPHLFKEG